MSERERVGNKWALQAGRYPGDLASTGSRSTHRHGRIHLLRHTRHFSPVGYSRLCVPGSMDKGVSAFHAAVA